LPPAIVAAILEDLQLKELPGAHVHDKDQKIKLFLISLHHLKHHWTQDKQEAKFDVSLIWGQDWYVAQGQFW
jgi:hypothetical protein